MSQGAVVVQLPPGQETVTVKLINPVNFGPAIIDRFMEPPVPGVETLQASPSFSFLLEHPSGRKLVFDLGIRKDYKNYSLAIRDTLHQIFSDIRVTASVADVLQENGIATKDIEALIWSHWHWDHVGDPSTFPITTDLVVGPGFKQAMLPGYPANPQSPILESDYAGRKLREITFDGPDSIQIGQFPAFDYFGDGSFYLLDSPGHAVGHICGLARTTTSPDTFVLLGGDVCFYAGAFRPSKHMQVPDTIDPHPCNPHSSESFSARTAFEQLQEARGRGATDALFDITFGENIPLAKESIEHLKELDCNENVFTIVSHDCDVRDGVPHFPDSLNAWKERGWGKRLRWNFFSDLEKYWELQGLA